MAVRRGNATALARHLKGEVDTATDEILHLNETLEHRNHTLRERSLEYVALFEGAGAGIAVIDPQTGRFLRASDTLCKILGYDLADLMTKTYIDVTPEEFHAKNISLVERIRSGNLHHARFEKPYLRSDGETIWGDVTITALRDRKGNLTRLLSSVQDITGRKRIEQERILLVMELHHRLRNVLQVVASIAMLSQTRAPTVQDFVDTFRSRIAALSSSIDLAFQRHSGGAPLTELVEDIVRPFGRDVRKRITCELHDVHLGPSDLQSMSLVLHELTVNAVRHGALKPGRGSVRLHTEKACVSRGRHLPDCLKLTWQEKCDPGQCVSPPQSRGFGLQASDLGHVERARCKV